MNLYAILSFHGMKTGASKPSGLRERRSEEDHCRQRCGAEETIKEGIRKENPVVIAGISEAENEGKKIGWDKQTCLVESPGDYNFIGINVWPVFK
jgi:hypothetical protein